MSDPAGALVLVTLALFTSGLIKGCTGFGAGLLSVSLVAQAFPEKSALAALTLPLWLNNVLLLRHESKNWPEIRSHWPFLGAAVVGTLLGAVGFTFLPTDVVRLSIGVYLVLYLAAVSSFRSHFAVGHAKLGGIFGAVGGIITGAILIGGPLFVSYLHAKKLERGQFVAVVAATFFITLFLRMVLLGSLAVFGQTELILGAAFGVPLFIGVYAGTTVRPYVPQQTFEWLVKGLLLVVAVKLLYDGIMGSSLL